ncbi:hypothetical protein EZ449_12210 [Pedobacter frigidisoli]|uniref:RelA/SpoT domain-containing protein n=1 Tax=Pedobacter frigidisoli TaxID=2530455 RepID=A0A4V2MMT8_9SPHI|nr:hypothetical protein [Pedobacter frigidisoli]TCD08596.1 hypothetical protein EZ449_12210 [Pedobacter frigidisoli]
MISKADFFKKYNILEKEFEYNESLDWRELNAIYEDYVQFISKQKLDSVASHYANMLAASCSQIHSIRFRMKDPEHLIEKIIREKIKNKNNSPININNYRTKVEDIIGIRLLHVFKHEWKDIHKCIEIDNNTTPPYAFCRDGDDEDFIREVREHNLLLKHDEEGYRSIQNHKTMN